MAVVGVDIQTGHGTLVGLGLGNRLLGEGDDLAARRGGLPVALVGGLRRRVRLSLVGIGGIFGLGLGGRLVVIGQGQGSASRGLGAVGGLLGGDFGGLLYRLGGGFGGGIVTVTGGQEQQGHEQDAQKDIP